MVKAKDQKILDRYKHQNPWGMSMSVDLYDCNPKTIRSRKSIAEFVDALCKLIKVTKFGKTVIVNFGENKRVAGYSMTQLIETSLISGHFANESNCVYLDIFSCKEYPPHEAAAFCKSFFEAKKMRSKITFRQ
ncbi:MAG: S-adenosylmethionine decarboxylase [Patescibacteria group bacterium]|jgi:S-adenosylmethionine/arginine decarboxylase-like enzyme